MQIEVEVLSDKECRNCIMLDIDVTTTFANNEVYDQYFRCKNLDRCKIIMNAFKEKKE